MVRVVGEIDFGDGLKRYEYFKGGLLVDWTPCRLLAGFVGVDLPNWLKIGDSFEKGSHCLKISF